MTHYCGDPHCSGHDKTTTNVVNVHIDAEQVDRAVEAAIEKRLRQAEMRDDATWLRGLLNYVTRRTA